MRKWRWLTAGALLLAVALYLLFGRSGTETKTSGLYPEYHSEKEVTRRAQRVQQWKRINDTMHKLQAVKEEPADPFSAMLSPFAAKETTLAVVELAAIRRTKAGELLLRCQFYDGAHPMTTALRENYGIGLSDKTERFAFSRSGLIIEGDYDRENLAEKLSSPGLIEERRGDHGKVIIRAEPEGKRSGFPYQDALAVYKDQILIFAEKQTVADTLAGMEEGAEAPVFAEEDRYGEVYGVIPAKELITLFPKEKELQDTIMKVVRSIKYHVDLSDGMTLTVDFVCEDNVTAMLLAKGIEAALSAYRIKSFFKGDTETIGLLDKTEIDQRQEGTFTLSTSIPYDMLEKIIVSPRCPRNEPPQEGFSVREGE